MCTVKRSKLPRKWISSLGTRRTRILPRSDRYPGDRGVTLLEVIVSFVVLLIALIPLSYLFTTAIIQAGQSVYQQTALSIAEGWTETLSNTTPPVNPLTGAVIVDTSEAPSGPAPSTATTTVAGTSIGKSLATTGVSTLTVTSAAVFAAASTATPQVVDVTIGTGASAVVTELYYTQITGNILTCSTNPCNSSSTGTMSGTTTVTQTEIATATETRGATTYNLSAKYEWATVQNSGVVSTTTTSSVTLPASVIPVNSISGFTAATGSSPQSAKIGGQTVFYTFLQSSPTELTGVTGGTGTFASGTTVKQNPKPNLCTSGTPQLLKMTITVSWGPNADTNNIQDSVVLNYPPSGVQTLGFLALQVSGDSEAADSQGDPWSTRVTAVPVTFSGPQTLNLYPDQYGCVFAQVKPGTYTVSVGQPSSGTPQGTSYNSTTYPQPFVANAVGSSSAVAGSYSGHVWSPPDSPSNATEPVGTAPAITVSVGTVTRVDAIAAANYPPYDEGSTINWTFPSTTAVDDGVVCPGVNQIACVASGQNSAGTAQIAWTPGSSWSNPSLPVGVSLTRMTSMASASTTACIGVGFGSSGAVILHGTTSSPILYADPVTGLAGLSSAGATLTQVVCPSATQCMAIGTNSSGAGVIASGAIGAVVAGVSTDTWTLDTVSTATTSLSSLQCPIGAGCAVIGTTSTSPVILSGPAGSGTFAASTFPTGASGFSVTTLSHLLCPTTTNCMAIGTGEVPSTATTSPAPPLVISGTWTGGSGVGTTGATQAWNSDAGATGTTLTSVSAITCPSTTKCLVTGTGTLGANTGALFLYGSPAGPTLGTEFPLNGGAAVTSIGQITCPVSGTCAAIGNNAGTPVIFTGTILAPATADTWHSDNVPNGSGTVTSLTKVVCPSTASCLVMGAGTLSGSPAGFLLYTTTLGGTTTSWINPSLPDQVLYFDGIDCTPGASGTCAAVGATPTGAVVLTSTTGPAPVSDVTPAGLSGNTTTGVPVEINNTSLNSGLTANQSYVNAITAGGTTNVTQLPQVFPFSGGYNMFAGDCPSEGTNTYTVAQATTIPGGTSATTVPLGLLSVKVTTPSGSLAHSGVTLQIKTTAVAGCGTDTYTLPTTAADGLSRTAVPYGSYSLFVNGSSTAYTTVVVTGNTAVVSGATVGNGTYVLPTPIGVVA